MSQLRHVRWNKLAIDDFEIDFHFTVSADKTYSVYQGCDAALISSQNLSNCCVGFRLKGCVGRVTSIFSGANVPRVSVAALPCVKACSLARMTADCFAHRYVQQLVVN